MAQDDRKHFLVKHDLESLLTLPHFIWNIRKDANHAPPGYGQLGIGDLWVSFAYIDNERDRREISQITGFSECVRTKGYGPIPRQALSISNGKTDGWFVEGKAFENQPSAPVDVPPIETILGRSMFRQKTIHPITAEEFERLRQSVLGRP
jgi:hypothetical protein